MAKDRPFNRKVMPDEMVIQFLTGDTMMINGWLRHEVKCRYVEMLKELEELRDKLKKYREGEHIQPDVPWERS